MKLLNNTTQKQQVCFTDGTGETVRPGDQIVVDVLKIYPHELKRISSVFKVLDASTKGAKKEAPKVTEVKEEEVPEKKKSFDFSGKEKNEEGGK